MDTEFSIPSSFMSVNGSQLGSGLMNILMSSEIVPGSDISYQLAKDLYIYHPLGGKMAEAPVALAQSQPRQITAQGAPEEAIKAFQKQWEADHCDYYIFQAMTLSRVYGLSSVVLGCKDVPGDQPLDMKQIWKQDLWYNVLDPLNTAGSLVLSQIPTAPDFQKPVVVRTNNCVFHRSRYQVVMNEQPVYLSYTGSAFGFVGRSVYQRALFPMKSYIRTMLADDMIATKLGLLVAKMKPPGSIIDKVMQKIGGLKRALLKQAQTYQVLTIDPDEDIETLNMTNVDTAGNYARGNILKNIATAADMPAKLLENETMVEGFGEGTEDAKTIVHYIERFREKMQPLYGFFDNITRYRAWNDEFIEQVKGNYPNLQGKTNDEIFLEWRQSFQAIWPSLMIEPKSESVKVEETKLKGINDVVTLLLPNCDPDSKTKLLQWATDNMNENKEFFPFALSLDWEAMQAHQEELLEQEQEQLETQNEVMLEGAKHAPVMGAGGPPGAGGKGPGGKGAPGGKVGSGTPGGGPGAMKEPGPPKIARLNG